MAEDFFDLSGMSDDDWKDIENPSPIPAGWYRAKVAEMDADTTSGNLNLYFQVTAGPFRGKKVKKILWNPENSDTEEKAVNSRRQRMLFATRLGLITAADKAKRDQQFRVLWDNAMGAEVWIKVELRPYDKKDKATGKPTGEKGVSNELTYDGVYPITDERVPEDVRKGAATGTAAAPSTPARPNGSGKGSGGQAPVGAGVASGAAAGKPNLDDLM